MATSLASATIERAGDLTDIAVPRGTTVAGLLAMMRIDTSTGDLHVTLADGSPADASWVVGDDIPSGSLLSVAGQHASRTAVRRALRAQAHPWTLPSSTVTLALMLLAALTGVALVGPLTGLSPRLPTPLAPAASLLGALLVTVLVLRSPLTRSAPGLLALSLAVAPLPLGLLDPRDPSQVAVAVPLAAWTAFSLAAVAWALGRSRAAAALAAGWLTVAVAATVVLALGVEATTWAPLLVAVAVLVLAAAPDMAVNVPSTQLLDLPLVTTSAPTVRAAAVRPPARITPGRVQRTVRDASALSDTVVMLCCAAVPVGAPVLGSMADPSTWEGRAALGLALLAVAALSLLPRASRSPLARILPRASACLLLVVVLTGPLASSFASPEALAALLVILGLVVVGWTLAVTRDPRSAFIARMADVLHSVAMVLILPVAVYAAGLFDLIRQVAS